MKRCLVIILTFGIATNGLFTGTFQRQKSRKDTTAFSKTTANETADPTFNSKSYKTETADGAILTLFRLKPKTLNPRKRPILMLHGLGCSSDIFLLTQKHSLAYTLFKEGYDVWLGNFRSNDYCQESSVYMDIRTKGFGIQNEFWNHSFYELAIYDLPAQVGLVLNETKADGIHYVGHSMGSLTMFLAMDYYGAPELRDDVAKGDVVDNFQDKIIDVHALGPVWNLKNNDHGLVNMGKNDFSYFMIHGIQGGLVERMLYKLPFGVKPKNIGAQSAILKLLCGNDIFSKLFTVRKKYQKKPSTFSNIKPSIFTPYILHPDTYPEQYLDEILGHVPQTTSWKTMYHFLELSKYGKLSTYPFTETKACTGPIWNQNCTTTQVSRVFDLSNIKSQRIHLYSGETDTLSVPAEADDIEVALSGDNVVTKNVFEGMDHMGLLADKRAPNLVFKEILKRIRSNKRE